MSVDRIIGSACRIGLGAVASLGAIFMLASRLAQSDGLAANLQAVAVQPAIIAARRQQPVLWPLEVTAVQCADDLPAENQVDPSESINRWQGTLALACGDTQAVRLHLLPVAAAPNTHPIVPVLLAASYLADGRLDLAKQALGDESDILWRPFVTQAAETYEQGDIGRAVEWLDRAQVFIAGVSSEAYLAFYERGCIIYRDASRVTDAVEACSRLVELTPPTGTNWLMLGRALLAANEFEQALAAIQQAGRLAPQDGPTQYYLGQAYEGLADSDNAWQAYQRAVELAPAYGAVRLRLAEWELARGNTPAARLQLEAARQSDSAYARQQAERKLAELNTP